MLKPNYGIDAPQSIKKFSIAGFSSFLFALFIPFLIDNWEGSLFYLMVFWSLVVAAVYCLFTAGLMLYSSKYGKIKMTQEIVNKIHWQGDEQVLDIGCGCGLFLNHIAKKLTVGKVIGIDIWNRSDLTCNTMETVIDNIHSENIPEERVQILTAAPEALPFPDRFFDIIVSNLTLHNIKTMEGQKKACEEITRVMKPNGQLILIDYMYTEQYLEILEEMAWKNLHRSELRYKTFPPTRIITAIRD